MRSIVLASHLAVMALATGGPLVHPRADPRARCDLCDEAAAEAANQQMCQVMEIVYTTVFTFVPSMEETGDPALRTVTLTSPGGRPTTETTVITLSTSDSMMEPPLPVESSNDGSGGSAMDDPGFLTSDALTPVPDIPTTSSPSPSVPSDDPAPIQSSISGSPPASTPSDPPATSDAPASSPSSTAPTIAPLTTPSSTTTTTSTPSTTSEPPGPAFSCDPYGYLIQSVALYRVDLTDGGKELVKPTLGDGRNINAIGYHPKENVIYGITQAGSGTANLIAIYGDGSTQIFDEVPHIVNGQAFDIYVGEINDDYQFFFAHSSTHWWQMDLSDPSSSTYRTIVDSGISDAPHKIDDWVEVPGTGDNILWSVGEDTSVSPSVSILMKWNTVDHTWTEVNRFGHLSGNDRFGALYADNAGNMYGSENVSGDIYNFTIAALQDGGQPTFLTDGPTSSLNDGARCHAVAV